MSSASLYERLGGYDAISAVANDLLPRLQSDPLLGRFWANRGEDGIEREKQLLVDFLSSNAGGPMYYTGRDMLTSHRGMQISAADWECFLGHLNATLDAFEVPQQERNDVIGFIETTKADITEA
jgi:hemoglobin